MTEAELRETFRYHAPDQAQRERFEEIRGTMTEAAVAVHRLLPASREASVFVTLMQQAQMMANAAVAIHGLRR